MKNVLVCYQNGFFSQNGGVQKYCTLLADFLEENGFNVFFLSFVCDTDFKKIKGECYYNLPDTTTLDSKENTLYYNGLLEKLSINIVINNEATNDRFSFFIPNKDFKGNHIAIFHQNPLFNLNFQFDGNILSRLIMVLKIIKRRSRLKYLINKSDKLVFLSEVYVNQINLQLKLKSEKLISISNFVKTDKFFTQNSSKENTVLFVGRLDEVKQVDLLIEAWKNIEKKYPGWNLIIVGDGPKYSFLKDLVYQYNLASITFTGKTDPTAYYKRSKILCLPSKYEGFGLVLIEAMAYGTVPIAFNNWLSLSDIINDGNDGFIVNDKTANGLQASLERLLNNDKLLSEMSAKAFLKARKFDLDTIGIYWKKLLENAD